MLDDVIEIKKADQDSQWRLRPCKKCGGENVAYVQYLKNGQFLWAASTADTPWTAEAQLSTMRR